MTQPIADAVVRLRPDSSGFRGDASRQITSAVDSITRNVGRSMTVAGGLAGAAFTAAAAKGIQIGSQLEVAQAQFEILLGDADRAKQRVEDLFEFAKRTPFETAPIIEASRQLQNFGGDALASQEKLTLIGDAAAGASTPIQDLSFWVGRAYAAIQAGQPFGEAAMRLTELAVLTPKTRQEMEELQKSGGSAAEVFQLLEGDLGRFAGAMEKQANLGVGIRSTLSDIGSLAAGRIFAPLYDDTKRLGKALIDLSDTPFAEAVIDGAQQLVGTSGPLFDRVIAKIERLGETDPGAVIDRFEAIRGVVTDVDGALDNIPPGAALAGGALAAIATRAVPGLGLISPILSATAGAVLGLVANSDAGREAMGGLADAASDAAEVVGPELAEAVREVAPPLAEVVISGLKLATAVLPPIAQTAEAAASVIGPLLGGSLRLVAGLIDTVADSGDAAVPILAGLGAAVVFDRAGPGVSVLGAVATKIRDVGTAAKLTVENGGGLRDFVGLLGGGPAGLGAAAAGAIGVGLLTAAFVANRQQVAEAKAQADAYRDAIDETGSSLQGAAKVLGDWLQNSDGRDREAVDLLAATLDKLGLTTLDLADAFDTGGDASVAFQDQVTSVARDILAAQAGYRDYADVLDRIASGDYSGVYEADLVDDLNDINEGARSLNDSLDTQYDRFDDGRTAQELYGQLTRENASATELLTTALDALTAAQDRNAGKAKDLDDAQLAAVDATRRLEQALVEGGRSFDINTEAGSRNYRALRDSVRAQVELATAQLAVDGNTDQATSRLVLQAGALSQLKEEGALTTEQYESLLTQFGLTPEAIQTTVAAVGVEQTRAQVAELTTRLKAIDNSRTKAEIQALLDDAGTDPAKLAAVKARIDAYFRANPPRITPIITSPQQRRRAGVGQVALEADGGVLRFFSDGGQWGRERHIAQIAPAGAWRVWAEPETGGEAYIPLAPSKRDRSLSIWRETGRLLGAQRFADGGVTGPSADEWERWNAAVARFQAEQLAKWNAAVARFQAQQGEDARRAQEQTDEFNRRKFQNAVEWKFERSGPDVQQEMARNILATLEPWTDEWVTWSRRLEDATRSVEEAARATAEEVARNKIEWDIDHLEGERLVAALRAQRDQFAAFTDEWVGWARRVEQAEADLARQREEAARDAADAERRATDRREAQRVYQLNLQGTFGPINDIEEMFRRMEQIDGLVVS